MKFFVGDPRHKKSEEHKRKIGAAVSVALKGRKQTLQHKVNRGVYLTGDKASHWKGDNIGYCGIHQWIKKVLGNPSTCSECGTEELNNYKMHWANISGEYKRDVNDWKRLCASCHFKIDKVHIKGWLTRKSYAC